MVHRVAALLLGILLASGLFWDTTAGFGGSDTPGISWVQRQGDWWLRLVSNESEVAADHPWSRGYQFPDRSGSARPHFQGHAGRWGLSPVLGPTVHESGTWGLIFGLAPELSAFSSLPGFTARWDDSALASPSVGLVTGLTASWGPLPAVADRQASSAVELDPPSDGRWLKPTGLDVRPRSLDEPVTAAPAWVMSGTATGRDVRSHVTQGLVAHELDGGVNGAEWGSYASESSGADEDDLDPLGFVAKHSLLKARSLGTDMWEVWVCEVPDSSLNVDLEATVNLYNREITPFFWWLSDGLYRPVFHEGGTVQVDTEGPVSSPGDYGCEDVVFERSEGGSNGAIVLVNDPRLGVHVGTPGVPSVGAVAFPSNRRFVLLAPTAFSPTSVLCQFVQRDTCEFPDFISMDIVVHEIGHAIYWPHVYGPLQRDNGMDFMSYSPQPAEIGRYMLNVGTNALNRYTAGWIDPNYVAIASGHQASYLLSPVGQSGTQLLVLPLGEPGTFISLGARVAQGYDVAIPAEGVEAYRIDQRASVCWDDHRRDSDRLLCWGQGRINEPFPLAGPDEPNTLRYSGHVYGPGDQFVVEGFHVEVTKRVGDRFYVSVTNPSLAPQEPDPDTQEPDPDTQEPDPETQEPDPETQVPDAGTQAPPDSGSGTTGSSTAGFVAVSAGFSHTCGLRTDRSVTCWGDNRYHEASAPSGEFVAVSAGSSFSCGLRTDRSVTCWGWVPGRFGQDGTSDGPYVAVSVGDLHVCGLRTGGSVTCVGGFADSKVTDPPAGEFRTVSVGQSHACGLRADRSVACWGDSDSKVLDPPAGEFRVVSTGRSRSPCGVRTDGSVVCWGDFFTPGLPTEASFTEVSVGRDLSCGLRTDRAVTCWGNTPDSPSGSFSAVSVGAAHACGVRIDGSVVCWGDNTWGQADAPLVPTDEAPLEDHFTDDNGSVHEADINRIAAMGITRGCATTPTARYCPDAHVTRAQMAAFLLRATGEPDPQPDFSNTFTDVQEGVWYTNYVLRFAQLGVDTGSDGSWRPDDPLTRLDMAAWLTRMFDHITPAVSPEGLFDDIDPADRPLVEGLYHAGVTRGCSAEPLLYCPDEPVTRAQMASFITRSLP